MKHRTVGDYFWFRLEDKFVPRVAFLTPGTD